MPQVFNPSSAIVDHDVNGMRYKIDPGATIEVGDADLDDLLKLLGFLVLVEDGKAKEPVTVSSSGVIEYKETTIEEVTARHEAMRKMKIHCEEKVMAVDGATGRKKKMTCGFGTNSKRALLAHTKNEHPKSEHGIESMATSETTADDLKEARK